MQSGRAWIFGDHVDSDAILAARHLNENSPRAWAEHVLEVLRPEFPREVGFGDIVVAGRNFGCGSAREQAPMALRAAGVGAVIAQSFARMFFRNAFNLGLLIFECPEAFTRVHDGDHLDLDPYSGTINDLDQGISFQAQPLDPYLVALAGDGGLLKRAARVARRG
ncbi:MAG: 3-isopropylmalate dehydratase small subunit [Pseudomonadota bacterium]